MDVFLHRSKDRTNLQHSTEQAPQQTGVQGLSSPNSGHEDRGVGGRKRKTPARTGWEPLGQQYTSGQEVSTSEWAREPWTRPRI